MKREMEAIARKHLGAFIIEAVLFMLFFASFLFLVTMPTPASKWALVPHLLCDIGLLVLFAKHFQEDRPPLYWSGYDFGVLLLFGYLVADTLYSEVPAVSWRMSALYLDTLIAFFFGRMLFYHRLRSYVVGVLICALSAWALAWFLRSKLLLNPEPDTARLQALEQTVRIVGLTAVYFLIALPFLLLPKPPNVVFLLCAACLICVFTFAVSEQLGWLLQPSLSSESIIRRHERIETLETAIRILRNYPWTGCGLGTLPILFDAYKQSPEISYREGFNAYLYLCTEIGIVGLVLFLGLFVRFPIYVVRHWRLFPNRRMRMSIFVFLCLSLVALLQALYDGDLFTPGSWFLLWTNFGILLSLVTIRDPVRLYDTLFYSQKPAPGKFATLHWKDMQKLALLGGALLVLAIAEAAPYVAADMSRSTLIGTRDQPIIAGGNDSQNGTAKTAGQETASAAYARRLHLAKYVFPLLPEVWSRLGSYYQDQVHDPLEVYRFRPIVQTSYERAIQLNPYNPVIYEQLAFLYRDTNDPTRALDTLKRGVRNNPNSFVLRMLLVRELEKMGSLALATYHVKQALFRIRPDQAELYLRLAELYERRGMRERAVRYYQYARQVVPDTGQMALRMRRLRERLQIST